MQVIPYAWIGLLAAALVLPTAVGPTPLHNSWWIDWVWADQFTAELKAGNMYPRWLPKSHDGLGSPVFYYYPPVAFYVTGLFGILGLATSHALLAAFGIGFAASGVAMFHWLKGWTNYPLLASLFFMAAPYHIFDFTRRGALAESLAIAFIPLLALSIRRNFDRQGWALSAVAFAAMILTHVPLALLACVFLAVPYALFLTRKPRELARLAVPFLIGVGMSAIYLLPALALDSYRDSAHLWLYRPSAWSALATGTYNRLISVALAMIALCSLMLAIKYRSGPACYALAMSVLATGLVPHFWSLPLVSTAQFPFRSAPFAEFGVATALALLPRGQFVGALACLPALAVSAAFLPPHTADGTPSLELWQVATLTWSRISRKEWRRWGPTTGRPAYPMVEVASFTSRPGKSFVVAKLCPHILIGRRRRSPMRATNARNTSPPRQRNELD